MALPASTTKGSVLVYNTVELQSLCQIDAHRSPIAAVVFSSNGTYLATASEQGTIIRVHLVSQATKSYSFRRGTYPSTIYSLSFGPSVDLPDILVATSLSGSLHVFSLEHIIKQRNKRPSKLLGSMIPETINDALESTYHHVIHNVSLAGVKSYIAISTTEKVPRTSSSSTLRSSVFIITGDGHLHEYSLNFQSSNEFSWNLERQFNIVDTVCTNF